MPLIFPSEYDVRSGIQFGPVTGTEFTGNFIPPLIGDVESGVQFGGSGNEFTGSFVVPSADDVRDGIGFGAP